MFPHVASGRCNLLEAGRTSTAWRCEQPPLYETDVAQIARFGAITDQRDGRRSSSGPCCRINLLREMKGHGEHASRRFQFVRQTHDSYYRCDCCVHCRASAELLRLHTRSMRHGQGTNKGSQETKIGSTGTFPSSRQDLIMRPHPG
jgi:hypothetical protein